MRAYSICCAARHLDNNGHQQLLPLHPALLLLLQHLLKQDALMGHMLIDDPQAVAPGGDDEAVVNLAQGAQVRQRSQALWRRSAIH